MPERLPDTPAPETLDSDELWADASEARRPSRVVPALVVIWCRGASERVGDVLLVDPRHGEDLVLGRGDEGPPGDERARFVRQRPGTSTRRPAIMAPAISRRQLALRPAPNLGVYLRQLGRCPVTVNGAPVEEATLRPGDVVHLRHQLVLLCEPRPTEMAPLESHLGDVLPPFGRPDFAGMLGEHPEVWRLRERLWFAARSERHVLLTGPSGSGKELAARAIHEGSARAHRPLVARNAATLPASLIDAELFGNVRGYPSSDMRERAGLIGEADGSTLLLDEIGDLPESLQTHLLRVLDRDGEYHRLGEARLRRSRFCLVAATNRDPEHLRSDFLARFRVRVSVPGLNTRRSDIPLLVRHLLDRASRELPDLDARFFGGRDGAPREPRVTPELITALVRHDYRAHVRELETALWASLTTSTQHFLALTPEVEELLAAPADEVSEAALGEAYAAAPRGSSSGPAPSPAEIEDALRAHAGNVQAASRALGLESRYVLYRLMRKHGIDPAGFRVEQG